MQGYKVILLLVSFAFSAKATIFPSSQGPVSLGVGAISTVKDDPFAAYNHQGGLAFIKNNSVSFGFQSNYFVEGLNTACLAANYKINQNLILGIGYSFLGNQYYNEGLLKISLAKKFSSHFGGGVSLDYLRLQLPKESFPVKNLLTFEAGIYTTFNKNFDFAMQVINPARVPLASYNDERLPFITNTTLIYKSTPKISVMTEWNQIMNSYGSLKVGINYQVSKKLNIRAGMYNKPANPCFGISYASKDICIHLAFAMHPYLNAISAGAITFCPNNTKK